jgi:Cof subfamily protein (haloacid dehalogenase superfamily)
VVKLVFLDLDGTLIGSSGRVRPAVKKACADARKAGVRLSICTGRPGMGIAWEEAYDIDPDTPHIFQAGAVIRQGEAAEVVWCDPLPREAVAGLVPQAYKVDGCLELYSTDKVVVSRLDDRCRRHAEMLEIQVEEVDLRSVSPDLRVCKAQWIVARDQSDALRRRRDPGCESSFATASVIPDCAFISITRQGVNKAVAARWVCEKLGIDVLDTMAVADSVGDLSILECVGHPVVMANSPPELLARFPSVGDVEDDGVIEALQAACRP